MISILYTILINRADDLNKNNSNKIFNVLAKKFLGGVTEDIQNIITPIKNLIENKDLFEHFIKEVFLVPFSKYDFSKYDEFRIKSIEVFNQNFTTGIIIPKNVGMLITPVSMRFNNLIYNNFSALKITLGYMLLGPKTMSYIKEHCENRETTLSYEFILKNKFLFAHFVKHKIVGNNSLLNVDQLKIGITMGMLYFCKLLQITAFCKKYKVHLLGSLGMLFAGNVFKERVFSHSRRGMQYIINSFFDYSNSQKGEKEESRNEKLNEQLLEDSYLYEALDKNFKNNNDKNYQFSFIMDIIQKKTHAGPSVLALVNLILYNILYYIYNPHLAEDEIIRVLNLKINKEKSEKIESYIRNVLIDKSEKNIVGEVFTQMYKKLVMTQFEELELYEGVAELIKIICIKPEELYPIIMMMIPHTSYSYMKFPGIKDIKFNIGKGSIPQDSLLNNQSIISRPLRGVSDII